MKKAEWDLAEAVAGRQKAEDRLGLAKEALRHDREEIKKLEKMIMDQQVVIKAALHRVLPGKHEVSFCQEHVQSIKHYLEKHTLQNR